MTKVIQYHSRFVSARIVEHGEEIEVLKCALCGWVAAHYLQLRNDHCHLHNEARYGLCDPCNRMVERSGIYGQVPKIGYGELLLNGNEFGPTVSNALVSLQRLCEWRAPSLELFRQYVSTACQYCRRSNPHIPVFEPVEESYEAQFDEVGYVCGCGNVPDNRSPEGKKPWIRDDTSLLELMPDKSKSDEIIERMKKEGVSTGRRSQFIYRVRCERELIKRFGDAGRFPTIMIRAFVRMLADNPQKCLVKIADKEPAYPSAYLEVKEPL